MGIYTKWVLWIVGGTIAELYLMFVLYLAMMPLKRSKAAGNLTNDSLVLGLPWLGVMLVVDFIFNIYPGSLLFLMPPTTWVFTARLDKMEGRTDWRGKVAHYICTRYLDRFDPAGHHCEVK